MRKPDLILVVPGQGNEVELMKKVSTRDYVLLTGLCTHCTAVCCRGHRSNRLHMIKGISGRGAKAISKDGHAGSDFIAEQIIQRQVLRRSV